MLSKRITVIKKIIPVNKWMSWLKNDLKKTISSLAEDSDAPVYPSGMSMNVPIYIPIRLLKKYNPKKNTWGKAKPLKI